MDSSVPMILPKGIVINSKNIYKEVANFPLVPPDKVWEYWHGTRLLRLTPPLTASNIPLTYLQYILQRIRSSRIPLHVDWKTFGGMSGAAIAVFSTELL